MALNQKGKLKQTANKAVSVTAGSLARTPLKPFARVLLQGILLTHPDQPVKPAEHSITTPGPASGPFAVRDNQSVGDLLIYVPRSIESHLIDHVTGGYGYSHVAIDTGEVDMPSGLRVMVESTVNHPVWRVRQDRYGDRPYVRIRLRDAGIDPGAFSDCVKSKLGEQYDNLEALTWGAVDDPAKQICSDLAAECLPPDIILQIVNAYMKGKLRRNSISVHKPTSEQIRAFVSPNGFSQYFGAPPGNRIRRINRFVAPPQRKGVK